MSEKPNLPSTDSIADGQNQPEPLSSVHAAYNMVTDTVVGVNVRWSDNKFQAVFVCVSVALASLAGAILAALNAQWDLPWYGGALIGSFAGLVIGIFASGIFLMVYRAARHLQGRHD